MNRAVSEAPHKPRVISKTRTRGTYIRGHPQGKSPGNEVFPGEGRAYKRSKIEKCF